MAKCERAVTSQDSEEEDEDAIDAHLEEVPDGAGCTGIWEYLSERRAADDD